LHTILTTVLEDILYQVPDRKIQAVHITRDYVTQKLHDIVKDRDLSRYIL